MNTPEQESLVRNLGSIVINGQSLELLTGLILAKSLGIRDEFGALLAGRLGVVATLDVIRTLAKESGYPLDGPAVEKWVIQARQAVEARNEAMHSVWLATAPDDEINTVLRRGLKREKRSPEDLAKTITLLQDALIAARPVLWPG